MEKDNKIHEMNGEIPVENAETVDDEVVQDEVLAKMGALEKELEEWKTAYARKLADFQNYSKRKDNELNELKKYAAEGLILKMLDNVDNLERAVQASKENKDADSLIAGLDMVLKGIKEVLTSEGLEEIEAEGREYDPYEHQAMMVENMEEKDNNIVLDVFNKGYKLKGKVIRPAMVKVNKKN
jgi:molecular chaperone GrpE